MTKQIKLEVGKRYGDTYPLVDESGKRINPKHIEYLSDNLIEALGHWQQDYDESTIYSRWSSYSKLDFERQGLTLAQCISVVIPKDTKVTYFSELYQQEIEL